MIVGLNSPSGATLQTDGKGDGNADGHAEHPEALALTSNGRGERQEAVRIFLQKKLGKQETEKT